MSTEHVFDWHGIREGFLKHLVVCSISGDGWDADEFEQLSQATNHFTDIHLTMQLGGVDVDPMRFLQTLERQYDRQIELAAKKLVEDVGLDMDGLYKVARDVERYARNKLQEFGVEYHEDELR